MPSRTNRSLPLNTMAWDPHPGSPLPADHCSGCPLRANSKKGVARSRRQDRAAEIGGEGHQGGLEIPRSLGARGQRLRNLLLGPERLRGRDPACRITIGIPLKSDCRMEEWRPAWHSTCRRAEWLLYPRPSKVLGGLSQARDSLPIGTDPTDLPKRLPRLLGGQPLNLRLADRPMCSKLLACGIRPSNSAIRTTHRTTLS